MIDGPPRILALDLATRFGWAFGVPGEKPLSGSHYFTKDGCAPRGPVSNGAKYWHAMRFASSVFEEHRPTHVVCEQPIAPNAKSGQTSTAVFEVLYGLPAAVRGMLFGLKVYAWEYATPSTVRRHFIGNGGLKGEDAKPIVFRKCLALGWVAADDEDLSYDRTDALAIWSWAETNLAPKLAQPVDDLFVKAQAKRNRA